MDIIKTHNLACPIDGTRFVQCENQLVCANGHSFDIARQGYVNLLPVQQKRSKQPGDSKAMVLARVQFLKSGLYEPIANKLAENVFSQIAGIKEFCLLDAGCGEGYYLDRIFKALKDRFGRSECSFIGLDISKEAIAQAAKRNQLITWLVGTNRQPPVEDASVDVIVCVFGFQSFEGFYKILKPGGKVILVDPGIDHLKELREIIYSTVKKTDSPELASSEIKNFSLLDRQRLQFKTGVIDHQGITNLLMMTPHFYRATKEGKAAVGNLQELDLTVDVTFSILGKSDEKCL